MRRTSAGSRGRFAPYVLGVGLFGVALLNVVFGLYALLMDEPIRGHALAALLGGGFGGVLLVFGHRNAQPTRREGLIAVTLLWVVVTVVGALPYRFGGGMSLVNALFESASGFTATGATALDHFDTFPASLFIYRAVSQWLGGIGIIVLFIIVLPAVRPRRTAALFCRDDRANRGKAHAQAAADRGGGDGGVREPDRALFGCLQARRDELLRRAGSYIHHGLGGGL